MLYHSRHVNVAGQSGDLVAAVKPPMAGPMRRSYLPGMIEVCASLIIALASLGPTAQAESAGNPELDGVFQKLARLELGQDLQLFRPIEQAVAQARMNQQARTDLEARLVATVQGGATDLGKEYACRQLAIVGSDASVPVLAALLPNPRLSHMARFALEGIGSPAATKVLREMLEKTAGRQKVGVVVSLGRLADADAVPLLSTLLAGENEELREAALVALGRIGNDQAAEAIRVFSPKAPKSLQNALVDAQLDAAESLRRQGQFGAAVAICASLESADAERVRSAAFRGLISAKPAEKLRMILAELTVEEPWKRAVAADAMLELKSAEEIRIMAAAIPGLPIPGKVAALNGLRDRRDPAVREAALKSLDQPDTEVRIAALTALVASATTDDVPVLVHLASTAEDVRVRDAAGQTLRLTPVKGVNEALLAWMNCDPKVPPIVVRCALARRWPGFVPGFLKAAQSSQEITRREALTALEIMATAREAEAIVDLLLKTAPGEDREIAGRAAWMICQRIPDPAARGAPLAAALEKADTAGRCAILPCLARFGGEKTLSVIHEAIKSNDPALRDAGYRGLANWPDATVADELLGIAKTNETESYRIWALRAYARVVSSPSDRSPQRTYEMLDGALKLATRTEDKELIISRLASVRVPDALARLLSFVDQPELKGAAIPAVFTLAKGLSQSHPDQARAALERIRSLIDDPATIQQIPKVLRDIEARKQGKSP